MRALVVLLALAGCGTLGNSRDDLQQAASMHHIDLRWGRLENAAQRVTPEMRGAFLTSWATRMGGMELQDIEVTGLVVDESGESADVVINVTYIERDTMSVKSAVIAEKWTRVGGNWLASKPAEPPTLAP